MPGLLDLIAPSPDDPTFGGLLGSLTQPTVRPVLAQPGTQPLLAPVQPGAPPPLAPQPSGFDRALTRLLGGREFGTPRTGLDMLLTPADEHRARQQAVLNIGLSLLANSAPHNGQSAPPTLAALAQALQAGRGAFRESIGQRQQAALQGRALQQDEALQKARAQIAEQFPITPDMTPEQQLNALRGQFAAYAAAGDSDMVAKLNSVAPALFRTSAGTPAANKIVTVDGRTKLINPVDGSVVADLGEASQGSTARARVLTGQNGEQYVLNSDGSVSALTDAAGKPIVKFNASRVKSARVTAGRVADIDNAISLVQQHPDSFGLEHGRGLPMVGGVLDVRTDPTGVAARAAVANIGSLIIHDRSGAAVTVSEFPRLQPFIPAIGDPPSVIVSKLKQLRSAYQRIQQQLDNGTPLSDLLTKPAPSAGADLYRKYGLTPPGGR